MPHDEQVRLLEEQQLVRGQQQAAQVGHVDVGGLNQQLEIGILLRSTFNGMQMVVRMKYW